MNYHQKIMKALNELHALYPSYDLGKHLSTALDGHDMWGISDREFYNAIIDYKGTFELDLKKRIDEEEISKIIRDGMHLNSFTLTEDDDEFYE